MHPLLSHPSLHSVLTSHAMTKRVTMSDQFGAGCAGGARGAGCAGGGARRRVCGRGREAIPCGRSAKNVPTYTKSIQCYVTALHKIVRTKSCVDKCAHREFLTHFRVG